jgi:c-di-GMP-binding flagellar brake protein YcgR
MEHEPNERRLEARYPIEAKVIVHRNSGESISATATNISGGGMLLHVEQPSGLRIGDPVTVDVELPDDPDKPFASWGIGKVVRLTGGHFGIQLKAGTFGPGDHPGVDPGAERLPEV